MASRCLVSGSSPVCRKIDEGTPHKVRDPRRFFWKTKSPGQRGRPPARARGFSDWGEGRLFLTRRADLFRRHGPAFIQAAAQFVKRSLKLFELLLGAGAFRASSAAAHRPLAATTAEAHRAPAAKPAAESLTGAEATAGTEPAEALALEAAGALFGARVVAAPSRSFVTAAAQLAGLLGMPPGHLLVPLG